MITRIRILSWFRGLTDKERSDFVVSAYHTRTYKIYCNGKAIVQFENKEDREYCLNLLKEINKEKTYIIN